MDKQAAELSRAGLELFSHELSPEYRRVRELLIGRLAAHGATTEQLIKKERNDRKNVELLTSFAKLLPRAEFSIKHNDWQFVSKDPYEVRMIQSNVVWSGERSGLKDQSGRGTRPYYVVGKSGIDKDVKLLLVCAGVNDFRKNHAAPDTYGGLFCLKLNRRNRKIFTTLNDVAKRDYPSPEEMTQLFDLERHKLIIGFDSPGSTQLWYTGIVAAAGEGPLLRISDNELGTYDANSHLHRIATAFDKVEALHQILAENTT